MPELSVAVFATDNDQRAVLQVLVDGTSVARTVCSNATMPLAATDPVIRKTQALPPDVILVDIAADGDHRGSARHRIAASGTSRCRRVRRRPHDPAATDRQRHAGGCARVH